MKVLCNIRDHVLLGDPLDISEYFVNLNSEWLNKGFDCLTVDRTYESKDGFLVLYGTESHEELTCFHVDPESEFDV